MGEAGFGAEEQASRRGRRIAQLRAEQARGDALDAEVQAQLVRAQRAQRAWSVGAEGERLVAAAIDSVGRYGWTVLHDLHWPGRPKANLDHVAIGPGGVILVDAKNWTGDVLVSDGKLRQNGYDRMSQVESVARAAADLVAELAPSHRSAVRGVVCLAGQDLEPTALSWGITVVGRAQLPKFLAGLAPRLTPFDVADVGRYLARHLGGETSPGTSTKVTRTGRSRPHPRQRVTVESGRTRTAPSGRKRATQRKSRQSAGGALLRLALVVGALLVFLNVLSHSTGS